MRVCADSSGCMSSSVKKRFLIPMKAKTMKAKINHWLIPAGSMALAFFLLGSSRLSARNVYPDPSFEICGESGNSRTGAKAGHLKIERKQRAKDDPALMKCVEVEPFATYRFSAWVKAKAGAGNAYALYCHQTDFRWANMHKASLAESPDWTQVEIILSPFDKKLYVRPLFFSDASNWEAWIDDVRLEKIKNVDETIAALTAKNNLSADERRLLARFWVSKGEFQKAIDLTDGAGDLLKADVACLMAQSAPTYEQRRSHALEMARLGGLEYQEGTKRFKAIVADCSVSEKAEIFGAVLLLAPDVKAVWNFYAELLQSCAASMDPVMCGEWMAALNSADAFLEQMRSGRGRSKVCLDEAEKLRATLETARIDLEKRRKALGHCEILLGGKALHARSHAIVVPDVPSKPEQFAAKELQYHFELLTGRALPILKDAETAGDKRSFFVIGKSRLLTDCKINVDWEKLGKDGILIKASGPHLFLCGGQRGVLYACYSLLEDFLGLRWFSPDCRIYPREGVFDLASVEKLYTPILEFRDHDSFVLKADPNFPVRNKLNGHRAAKPDEKRGGNVSYAKRSAHTFNDLVPVQEYFVEHPEYFSEVAGKRYSGRYRGDSVVHAQLCLSNPAVEDLVVEGIKRWLMEYPGASIVSVTQNDGNGACECAKCKAVDEAEESHSGSLLRFVNRVAARVEPEFPNAAIDTFAYGYSRKPPKLTKPRSNVIVRLCNIECSFSTPLEAGITAENRKFCEDLRNWGKIASRLYVWTYVTNFRHYLLPHPNLRSLKPDIQFFIKNGVRGFFAAGNNNSAGGEFQELRTWLIAKLLWDPDADFEKLLTDFLNGYYGPAAPFVREYIDLIHDSAEETKAEMTCYTKADAAFLTPEVLSRASAIFDRAEEFVQGDAVFLQRVQTARLPVIFTILEQELPLYRLEGKTLIPQASSQEVLLDKFERIMKAAKVTRLLEQYRDPALWVAAKRSDGVKVAVKQIKNKQLEVNVLPGLGGRIWCLKDLASGREIFRTVVAPGGFQINEGGYEEYSTKGYRSSGWHESYQVKESTAQRLTLAAKLPNDFTLSRSFELLPDGRCLEITSTLTNIGKQIRKACFRIHPEFAFDNPQEVILAFKRKDGNWERKTMADLPKNIGSPEIAELVLTGEERPYGEWGFVDKKAEIGVINRFRAAEVGRCYIYCSSADKLFTWELWSVEKELRPGESIAIHQSYEIINALPETATANAEAKP